MRPRVRSSEHIRFLCLRSPSLLELVFRWSASFSQSSKSGVINRQFLELTSPVVSFLYGSLGRARVSGCHAGTGGKPRDSPGGDRVRYVVGGFQEITELTFRGPVPQASIIAQRFHPGWTLSPNTQRLDLDCFHRYEANGKRRTDSWVYVSRTFVEQ